MLYNIKLSYYFDQFFINCPLYLNMDQKLLCAIIYFLES